MAPVLIVEDGRAIRESLLELIEDAGYPAVAVEDGWKAYRYLQAQPPPCLVLLDLMLPVMDGFELRNRMLLSPQLRAIPVAVLSAVAAEYRQQNVLRAAAYLPKPFDAAALLELVAAHCAGGAGG